MLIVYASKTGQVQRFVDALDMRAIKVNDIDSVVDEPYVLITYTDGFGDVPQEVRIFLATNHKRLVAVAASGNRNWGANFAKSANRISHDYNVPILLKFELDGTDEDKKIFKERVRLVSEIHRTK